nr:ribosomal protein S6 [Cryptomonas borealis]
MSRIGKRVIKVPNAVQVKLTDDLITIEGPKGKLTRYLPNDIQVTQDGSCIKVSPNYSSGNSQKLYGTYRSLISNMIKGVSIGYEKKLELQGVGYRSQIIDKTLTLNIGYSHQVKLIAPEGITLFVENNTTIAVSGPDKELVGQVAANIRLVRPPEPYKGKGIRYQGEYVRKKVGKTGKK